MAVRTPRGLAALAAVAAATALGWATGRSASGYPVSDLARVGATDRVLILAPHPDDETLCCGGLIEQALSKGARVGIVWMTSGDGFTLAAALLEHSLWPGSSGMRELGVRRMQEARAAARALHVPTMDEFFLGYPDGGLQSMAGANFEVAYTSPHTALQAVSYEGTVAPGSSFKGRSLELQLGHIVDAWKPTFILAPSVLDQHPDHRATGQFAVRVLQERHELGRLRVWIVHGGAFWPWPRGWHPSAPLQPPGLATALAWTRLPLDVAEVNDKRAALEAHRTQMFGLEQRFLLAFVRCNELFASPPAP